ncbi:hypothetical protein LTR65_006142 [Meristemomyces frigidus]
MAVAHSSASDKSWDQEEKTVLIGRLQRWHTANLAKILWAGVFSPELPPDFELQLRKRKRGVRFESRLSWARSSMSVS